LCFRKLVLNFLISYSYPFILAKASTVACTRLFGLFEHKYNASKILLRPASEGTGLIAGGAARPVLELSGVKDIIAKSLGSNNPNNLVQATVEALARIKG
jgi:ribosomal protein S5